MGFKIVLGWIPGYSNIVGNETADKLADIGRQLNIPMNIEMDKIAILPIIR